MPYPPLVPYAGPLGRVLLYANGSHVSLRFQPHTRPKLCLPPPRPNPHRQCRPRAVDCGRSRRHVKRRAGHRRLCQPCTGRRGPQHQVGVLALVEQAGTAAPACAAPVRVWSMVGFNQPLSSMALRPAVQSQYNNNIHCCAGARWRRGSSTRGPAGALPPMETWA